MVRHAAIEGAIRSGDRARRGAEASLHGRSNDRRQPALPEDHHDDDEQCHGVHGNTSDPADGTREAIRKQRPPRTGREKRGRAQRSQRFFTITPIHEPDGTSRARAADLTMGALAIQIKADPRARGVPSMPGGNDHDPHRLIACNCVVRATFTYWQVAICTHIFVAATT
jgi:hypothetical protein